MRSKIEVNEYKDNKLKEDAIESVKFFQDVLGYFIAYDDLLSTWIKKGYIFTCK